MTFTRAIRHFLCQLMAVVLLFAQMAVAAYACSGALVSAGHLSAVPMAMASGDAGQASHCEQMGGSSKALCLEHCHGAQQSADTASPPGVQAALPLLLYVLPAVPLEYNAGLTLVEASFDGASASPPPPHAILHCVLRI